MQRLGVKLVGADGVGEVLDVFAWTNAERHPDREEVGRTLADDGIVAAIVERFGRLIGLWTDDPDDRGSS